MYYSYTEILSAQVAQESFSILKLTRFSLQPKSSINHAKSVVLIKHLRSLYFITAARVLAQLSFRIVPLENIVIFCMRLLMDEHANRMARQRPNRESSHVNDANLCRQMGLEVWVFDWLSASRRTAIVFVIPRFSILSQFQ